MEFATDVNLTRWVISTIALVFMLGAFALVMLKFRQGNMVNSSKILNITETIALSPRHKLHLIKDDKEEHVILLGPNGDTHISTRKLTKVKKPA